MMKDNKMNIIVSLSESDIEKLNTLLEFVVDESSEQINEYSELLGKLSSVYSQYSAASDAREQRRYNFRKLIKAGSSVKQNRAAIQKAIKRQHGLKIKYCAISTGEITKRIILPEECYKKDKHWYLWAYCTEREDMRTFRVDRILKLKKAQRPPIYADEYKRFLESGCDVEDSSDDADAKESFEDSQESMAEKALEKRTQEMIHDIVIDEKSFTRHWPFWWIKRSLMFFKHRKTMNELRQNYKSLNQNK